MGTLGLLSSLSPDIPELFGRRTKVHLGQARPRFLDVLQQALAHRLRNGISRQGSNLSQWLDVARWVAFSEREDRIESHRDRRESDHASHSNSSSDAHWRDHRRGNSMVSHPFGECSTTSPANTVVSSTENFCRNRAADPGSGTVAECHILCFALEQSPEPLHHYPFQGDRRCIDSCELCAVPVCPLVAHSEPTTRRRGGPHLLRAASAAAVCVTLSRRTSFPIVDVVTVQVVHFAALERWNVLRETNGCRQPA